MNTYLKVLTIFGQILIGHCLLSESLGVEFRNKDFLKNRLINKDRVSAPVNSQKQLEPQIFSQCIDHFDGSDCTNPENTWSQRYWIKDDYYVPGGPIFIMVGYEAPADGMLESFWWTNYAANYSALMIGLEHRFYGDSFPTRDTSSENLQRLLTTQQSLEDHANFIVQFKQNGSYPDAEWVAFGVSYSAILASWLKQKYPDLVKAAVASSPPVETVYDYPGFMETVAKVIKETDPDCYDKIYDAFQCMESIVNGSSCGIYTSVDQIPVALQSCNPIDFTNRENRERYFLIIAVFTWGSNWITSTAEALCPALKNASGSDPLEVYGNFLVNVGVNNCTETEREEAFRLDNSITANKNVPDIDEIFGLMETEEGRQDELISWYFQTCHEIGYFFSSNFEAALFGQKLFSAYPFGHKCEQVYGANFTEENVISKIEKTNEIYGGKNPDVRCVIFVNGDYDPWSPPSILDPNSPAGVNNTIIVIPKGEHCEDMQNYETHTNATKAAQAQIMQQIGIYLNDPTC